VSKCGKSETELETKESMRMEGGPQGARYGVGTKDSDRGGRSGIGDEPELQGSTSRSGRGECQPLHRARTCESFHQGHLSSRQEACKVPGTSPISTGMYLEPDLPCTRQLER
jgi:hypothetical protein